MCILSLLFYIYITHIHINSRFTNFPEFADVIYKNTLLYLQKLLHEGNLPFIIWHWHPSSPSGCHQKETPQKMENQQLVSPSPQCSSTPVGFGQGFLSNEHCDNTGASPILSWHGYSWFLLLLQHEISIKEAGICDNNDIIKNAKEELKRLSKMASRNVCCTFTVAVWSVYLHKGTLWSKLSLNDCTLLLIPGTFETYPI